MTSTSDETARKLLEGFYSRQRGLVAFLDESYWVSEKQGQSSFYLFSAALIRVLELPNARNQLIDAAGESYWHTTEVARRKQFARLSDVLGSAKEVSQIFVIAVNIDFDKSDLELARKETLVQLASHLLKCGVNLAIFETRNTRKRKNADAATLSKATAAGFLQGIRLVQVSPSVEPLLWIPDLVSWALRQELIGTHRGWFEPLMSKSLTIAWLSFDSENRKRPASASAVTSPELSGAPEGEKTMRSSNTSMAKNIRELQGLKDIVGTFSPPIIEPAGLRAWIKETFPR
jgi:hypothetical protein